jgi:hypothetical protein
VGGTLSFLSWFDGLRAKADLFERRGREGCAENAEKYQRIPKKEKKENETKNFLKIFLMYFLFSLSSFCALCETFAPSAFKNSPRLPLHGFSHDLF